MLALVPEVLIFSPAFHRRITFFGRFSLGVRVFHRISSTVGALSRASFKHVAYFPALSSLMKLKKKHFNKGCLNDSCPRKSELYLCNCLAPAKCTEHFNATSCNIALRNVLHAFGQRVAGCWMVLDQV